MDYMKGYFNRNKRRRASRKRTSRNRAFRKHIMRSAVNKKSLAAAMGVLAVVLLILLAMPDLHSRNGESGQTVSGSGVTVTPDVQVPVVTPQPTPRTKAVALTFDDGPSTKNTPKVLEILKHYNAHATFFVVGTILSAFTEVLRQ